MSAAVDFFTYSALPPKTRTPSMRALSPFPGMASKSVVSFCAAAFSFACITIALETGCSLFSSIEYAAERSSDSLTPSAVTKSVTFMMPVVIVPVLSRATI